MQVSSLSSYASPLPHVSCAAPLQLGPHQHLEDTYVFIESPHPNINSELAKCRGWIAVENLRMYVPLDHRTLMESAHTSHIMSA